MDRRRSLTRASGALGPAWRPVPMIRIDLDSPPARIPEEVEGSQVVWVEASRAGHMVGVAEVPVGALPSLPSLLEEMARASQPSPPRLPVADGRLPSASVIVPSVMHDPAGLRDTLASLQCQDYPRFEVLLVDNRRGDGARPAGVAIDSGVTVIEERRPGISAARNAGLFRATGEFVAFIDDDAVADPHWLRALGSRFVLDPEIEGIGGLVLPRALETEPQLWFEEYYGGFRRSFNAEKLSLALSSSDPLFPYAPGRFGTGCNMAFRTEALRERGGFDTALGTGTPSKGGEDLAMFISVILSNGIMAFEPSAIVRHSHRRTEGDFFKKVFCYGTGLSAMYTSLMLHDRAQVRAISGRLLAGLKLFMSPRSQRLSSAAAHYPRRAVLYELAGMAYGPFAYLKSSWGSRRSP